MRETTLPRDPYGRKNRSGDESTVDEKCDPDQTLPSPDPTPPPNGGFLAWLQVVGSFFLLMNSWGVVNTFGAFQTFYETGLLHTESASNISWIGSIQSFLLLLIGVIAGPLYDIGYFRTLIVTGTSLLVLGLMMTSLCMEYWQVLLSQGICVGLGTGCLFIPSMAIIPQYFTTKRALAIGVVSSGSSLGGVLYPIIFTQLQQRIGFPWATRILAFFSLTTCSIAILVMRTRNTPKQRRALIDLAAFKQTSYTLLCTSEFFGYVGLFAPIFYVQPFAIQNKLASEALAFYLVPILNAASIPGRVLPGYLARRFNPLTLLGLSAILTGALALCWIGIHSFAGLVAFSALYGFASGNYISLSTVALTDLTPDLARLGTRLGMCSIICSVGSLCGPPIAGAILGAAGSYLGVQLFAGLVMVVCGLFALCARVVFRSG